MYSKSKYVIETSPELGVLLIFSSKTGSVVKLDERETECWINNKIENLPHDTKKYLYEHNFLIDSGFDETGAIISDMINKSNNPTECYYRIMVTSCCNARCPYCFEKGINPVNMSHDVATSVSDFINENSKDIQIIHLEWFGGEPLLKPDIINQIWDEVVCANPNKTVKSSIITNGSLIDSNIIALFKKINLKHIQITLDGMSEFYNSMKRYIDKNLNFDTIINNIELLIKNQIKPMIRINVTKDTIQDVLNLIDYLYDRFKNNISVYCFNIFRTDSMIEEYPKYLEALPLKKLIEYGYAKPESFLKRKPVPCGLATFKTYVAIDPKGKLIKCCESMNHHETYVGNVWDGIDMEKIRLWQKPVDKKTCKDCKFFPMCLGGCKASQLGYTNNVCFKYKDQIESIIQMIYFKKHVI